MTIDLLGAIIFTASGIISGGTAAKGVTELYQKIQGKLKEGVDLGNDNINFKTNVDIYMDLIISSTIQTDLGFKFNTAGKPKDSQFKIEATNRLKVELKVGVKIKGEAALVIIKTTAYFEASASAEASITFGHGINYDDNGLYYRPQLGFDGLNAEYVIKTKAGLSAKKTIPRRDLQKKTDVLTVGDDNEGIISQGKYNEVVPKFDVIKSLEELFSISADIPLIKK